MTKKGAHDGAAAQGASVPLVPGARVARLRRQLLAWYAANKRDLPWRRTRDPYAVWLSEVMLQQTRVETVVPYYARFLHAFPTVHALAEAPEGDVLALWSGLGYYRRARMLHEGARHVARARGGAFPGDAEGLRTIPGIGPYTAGAVASIAFGKAAPLVDGNVARVLARLFAIEEDVRARAGLARVWALAGELVLGESPGEWNQALMELGATICAPREPRCEACPVASSCEARGRGLERRLPLLRPKTKPKDEARVAIVATRGDAVLLAQRKTALRFGGLWEPPGAEGRDASGLTALAGAPLSDVREVGSVVHVLSHRRLDVTVYAARIARAPSARFEAADYDRRALVPLAELRAHGLSTLARKILARANVA
jgi:A/G-specific adenine glycosylase